MKLEGSCHCAAVSFSLESHHPQPYMRCYCSICRKAGGGGGYGINIAGTSKSLEVAGKEHVRVYRAKKLVDGADVLSAHERHFCSLCGCHLWAFNSNWPELLHPVASAIDTQLPTPVAHEHIMLASKASWVEVEGTSTDSHFDEYPEKSITKWHEDHDVIAKR